MIGWWPSLLVVNPPPFPLPSWLVPIGPAGFVVHVVFLLAAVVVLMNMELTLLRTLARHNGNMTRTAADLQISRPTLYELMDKLSIKKEDRAPA